MNDNARAQVEAKFLFLSLIQQEPGINEPQLLARSCASMYMDYFGFAQIRDEMLEKDFVTQSLRKGETRTDAEGKPLTRFDLTQGGQLLLQTLEPTMPDALLRYLEKVRSEQSVELEESATGSVEPSGAGDYYAHLLLQEKGRKLFECRLLFPTEEAAKQLVQRWHTGAMELYPKLAALLAEKP